DVQEFHLLLVHIDLFNGIGRTEAVLEHGAGAQIAQFRLDECAQVARRAMVDAEHGMQIIVVLNDHAGTKLGGRDRHRLKNSPYKLRFAKPAEDGQATSSAAGLPCTMQEGENVILHSAAPEKKPSNGLHREATRYR